MSELIIRRKPSFLDSSLRLDGITAILQALSGGKLTFSQVYTDSNIKFKKSFLKYSNYCLDHQFITKERGTSTIPNRWEGRTVMHYSITAKGIKFLEMIV